MKNNAKWIWYPGDFEIYHHLLLSCRRQEFGCDYPCAWRVSSPEKTVSFVKDITVEKEFTFRAVTRSKGMVRAFGRFYPVNSPVTAPVGVHRIEVQLYDLDAFPCFFIDSEGLITDESWTCEARDTRWFPVCCEPAFTKAEDNPFIFPFEYEKISPVKCEELKGGILYDFGRETFGPVTVQGRDNPEGITLIYGESRQEALDGEWSILHETLSASDSMKRPCRAFRYIFAKAEDGEKVGITAEYEYLPLEDRASFECDNPLIKEIWDVCSRTFHLNSREFFLDGIKRDRWVWSGDAYQSFMINRCLFGDNAITERTITALLGKPPYNMHINRINDYSCYLIISVWEHYLASGRKEFVERIMPNLRGLFDFIVSRLDGDGLAAPCCGDWVFIDWGELDKDGPHCAEQILLWKVYEVMTKLCALCGIDEDYTGRAAELKKTINGKYWDEEKGAYIDSFTSGRRFVSRQTNVLAVLFDFADGDRKKSVVENALLNPSLPAITTPYFRLYELLALCSCGEIRQAQEYILSYWGGMLEEGATSVWEEYDPAKQGDEHFAMYGTPFAKSLCHAWGSGPILILIRYCAGIHVTDAGGKSFRVEPDAGIFSRFRAKAPVGDGFVQVEYENGSVRAFATVPGGTLLRNGEETPIPVREI